MSNDGSAPTNPANDEHVRLLDAKHPNVDPGRSSLFRRETAQTDRTLRRLQNPDRGDRTSGPVQPALPWSSVPWSGDSPMEW